ncbi:MAG TPA: ATP-binding cassette domain-containing protein, partial [Flavisolibacter sp.]|nr:ATP-binding cassette domain-containing protein [Flavisolibacter sp.]
TEPIEGERKWGHNIEEAFYAQHQLEALTLHHTILEEMKSAGSQKTEQELRNLLGCFLFGGDDVDKKIRVLSGGEKARVALAKTIISKANFLLLDEPTNHLDIHSTELLIDALKRYEGTLVLVSHDRYFVSKTANKIWEIKDHEIKEFKGTYEEWVEWNERMAKNSVQRSDSKAKNQETKAKNEPQQVKAPEPNIAPAPPVVNTPINKEAKKELQKQQRLFQKLEEEIAGLNTQKTQLEAKLGSNEAYSDKNVFTETEKQYKAVLAKLSELNSTYEQVFEKLMELEGQ